MYIDEAIEWADMIWKAGQGSPGREARAGKAGPGGNRLGPARDWRVHQLAGCLRTSSVERSPQIYQDNSGCMGA